MSEPPVIPPSPDALRRARRALVAGLAAAVVIAVAGAIAGGLLGRLAVAGLSVGPFLLVGTLAHVGLRRRWVQVLAWIGAGLLVFGMGMSAIGMAAEAYESDRALRLGNTIAVLVAFGLAGAAVSPLRARSMRRLGMRPPDHVHHVAFFLCLGLTFASLAPLVGTGGRAILLDLMAAKPDAAGDLQSSALDSLLPLLWIIPGAFALVGYGVHRDRAGALDRLGLRWPGRRGLVLGVAVGVALVPAAMLFGHAIDQACQAIGLPTSKAEDIERLFDVPSLTIGGALALSIAAGVGEELAVRGVLQPRLGVLVANVFFAAFHAWQYTTEGVLVVFFIGLVLGELRRRTNTVASMLAHALYDFVLCMLMIAA